MKYFEIHVLYDEKKCDGYSIFVMVDGEEDPLLKARSEKLFNLEYDYEDVDYIVEITKEEYDKAVL